jgi:pyridoxal phosphate enzyme (YggS family)
MDTPVTAPDPGAVAAFSEARERVVGRIAAAAARAGRDKASVRLVAVTKTVPADRVRAAVAAGLTTLGENRVQELADKVPQVPGASWHLIGPVQSNKARRAVEVADVIESVDRAELARRLDRLALELRPGRPLPVLLQVNVDADPAKAGFAPARLAEDLPELLALRGLRVDGLMTVGRLVDDPEAARPTFVALRDLAHRLRAVHPGLGRELSMGMSADYPVAVEEGATIVRVGRDLFGDRPPLG